MLRDTKILEPRVGVEPTTCRLRKPSSSSKLLILSRFTVGTLRVLSGTFGCRSCNAICNGILMLLLLSPHVLAQERRTFTVPFHSVHGMILLDGQLNGKPAVFLLDTGANNSIADMQSAGLGNLKLDKLRSTSTVGSEGDCALREVHLTLEHRSSLNRRVCVMGLSDASRRMGTHLDGFIGADVLSEFRQVRLNYETHTLELEN